MLDYGYYSIITRKPHLGSFCTLLLCCCVFIQEDFLVLSGQTKHLKLPVHYGIKCFHCIQVHVAIMTSNCKNFSHQCCYANTTPGSCELCHIFPFVTAWVKALHWAQGRVVIKATCKQRSQGQFFGTPAAGDIQDWHYQIILSIQGVLSHSLFTTTLKINLLKEL